MQLAAAPHMRPESRIIAGIEASTITSLGTWQVGDALVGI